MLLRKRSLSANKKSLISMSIVLALVMTGIVGTIVAVLANQTQTVSSSISISYISKEVAARIKMTTIENNGTTIVRTSSSDSDYPNCIVFNGEEQEDLESSTSAVTITLTKENMWVVFEYEITNVGARTFKMNYSSINLETNSNMNVKYLFTRDKLTTGFDTNITSTTAFEDRLIAGGGTPIYYYIFVGVANPGQNATYSVRDTWYLDGSISSTAVTLNNGAGSGGLDQTYAMSNLYLPILSSFPTLTNKYFNGYWSEQNGGVQYVSRTGEPLQRWSGVTTLYARYEDALVVTSGVASINETAKLYTTSIEIPNTVTSIADNGFQGATHLESVALPNTIQTIGANAFKGCAALEEITIPSSVTAIGTDAFKDCSGLITVKIDSPTVANGLTSRNSFGGLVLNATTVYTISNAETGNSTYLLGNYFKIYSEDNAYNKFRNYGVPDVYQKVDFIQATGTQYIDTNYSPTVDTGIYMRFNLVSGYGSPFGCYAVSGDMRFWIRNGSQWYYFSSSPLSKTLGTGVVSDISMNYFNNKKGSLNGDEFDLSTPTAANMRNLYLFAFNSTTIQDYATGKLYGCVITEGDVVVRNFVPCYRKSDNEIGLYDTIGGVFYTNAGTGTFLKGATLYSQDAVPSGYQIVEYVESTGTQYIQTEYYANQSTEAVAIVESTSLNSQRFFGNMDDVSMGSFCLSTVGQTQVAIRYGKGQIIQPQGVGDYAQHIIQSNPTGYFVDGNNLKSWADDGDWQTGNPCKIFSYYAGHASIRIKSLIIKEEGETIFEFVPCYRKSDNEIGLYDIINGVFYTNAGTGKFVKGADLYDLPDTYQQVQYIESSGTQYINLGPIFASSNNKIYYKGKSLDSSRVDFLGLYNGSGQDFEFSVMSSSQLIVYYGNGVVSWQMDTTEDIVIEYTSSSITVNDVQKTNPNAGVSSRDCSLFAYNDYRHPAPDGSASRCYYLRVNNGTEDILNLIPCYRKSDGEIGLYDTVSGVFYTNAGTGTFVKGADVNN